MSEIATYPWGIVSDDPEVQAHYHEMRRCGESHAIAAMCALRRPPRAMTDSVFNEGRYNNNQFEATPWLGAYYKRLAEEAGVSVAGKHYCPGLADFPGDPTAWASGRGDVLRIAAEKRYRVDGAVNYTPPEVEPMSDVAIAPDLVDREVAARLAADPGLRPDDVREAVVRLRTGADDDGPLLVEDGPEGFEEE